MTDSLVYFGGVASTAILAAAAVAQAFVLTRFLRLVRRHRREIPPDDRCPNVMLVLCLRGADPFIERCLSAVLKLDYPRYRLRIVVDSRQDPAWDYVDRVLAEHAVDNVEVMERRTLQKTCGLKCDSLIDAVDDLDPSIEVVAQLDADVIPHRTWLRELVAPLTDSNVAIACGNRWYVPGATVGSVFRYLWNAPAVVAMHLTNIAWGGSLAMRASLIRQLNLRELWSRTLCEDTPLERVLRKAGLRMQFVPSLLMLNRESCTLAGIIPWIRRQLLIVRLHHPAWPIVMAHGIGTAAAVLLAAVVVAAGIVVGAPRSAIALPAAAIVGYFGMLAIILRRFESVIGGKLAERGDCVPGRTPFAALRIYLMIPFTQFLYAAIVCSVPFARRIDWRGVSYDVGRHGVRLIEYKPYADRTPQHQHASL